MGEQVNRADLEASLSRIGREAALLQDEALRADADPKARERFEAGWRARAARVRKPTRPQRVAWGAVALVAAAAVIALWARPKPLSFSVRDEAGEVGAWIVSAEALPLLFSDGTRLTLGDDALARVTDVTPRGAQVVVERGRVRASVVHTQSSHWKVDVGPFVVDVTGTTFDTGWDPKAQIFTLDLEEGSVVVTGCSIHPQVVRAGSSLRYRCRDGQVVADGASSVPIAPRATDAPAPPVAPAPVDAGDVSNEGADASRPPRGAPSTVPEPAPSAMVDASTAPSWRELAAHGANREAFAAALPEFDAECAHASAPDVLALADVARFAGDGAHARTALLAVRARFAGSAHATRAAFLLGRLAFDGGGLAEAARWFETASAEAPNGPLARESDGRLIEAREKSGDHAGARLAAQRYLQRYPSGPHAPLAIQVLER